MKIAFHGAARTVTGSKHLLTLGNNKKYLLDCGLFQGMGEETVSMNRDWGFNPSEVNYLVLTHAHTDHIGLVPKLVKDGFSGPIYCTPATRELASIQLEDAAGIQEDDVKYVNRQRVEAGQPALLPLFGYTDVAQTLKQFSEVEYNQWYRIDEQVELMYTDAGHIIGSAAINLRIAENGNITRLTFSGDIGSYQDLILRSPQQFDQADVVIMESTYGNRLHDMEFTIPDLLLDQVIKTCIEKKGKLIIPAFSLGRTQEVLYALNRLELDGRLPDLDYFVDSPLSIELTEVVKRYPAYFNDAIQKVLETDNDPFQFKGLKYISKVQQSKALNYRNKPCVIISASGMADSGRVKHHISNNIESSRNTILMVGYCEPSSLGGQLLSRARYVNIFGIEHEVNAEIASIKSMSAHGDYEDLCRFLDGQDPQRLKKIFLVHGEYHVQQQFKERLQKRGFRDIIIPERHAETSLD